MREKLVYMAMGAGFAAIGFIAGQAGQMLQPARAQLQTDRNFPDAPYFRSGREAIITSSADGRTLHFWSPQGTDEDLMQRTLPQYIGSKTQGRTQRGGASSRSSSGSSGGNPYADGATLDTPQAKELRRRMKVIEDREKAIQDRY
jgi:hypothetical protein